jgi:uncharacterized membrane protein YbjE (DUF340 family)
MEIERKIRMITKSITVTYYVIYLLTILAVVAIFFMTYANVNIERIDALSPLGVKISTVYMIYLLTSIPLALYLFHIYTQKLRKETTEFIQFQKYKKASNIRLWVVGIGLVVGVLLVYLLRSQSMIFTAAMAAIALYFCKPSGIKMIRELDLDADPNDFIRRF